MKSQKVVLRNKSVSRVFRASLVGLSSLFYPGQALAFSAAESARLSNYDANDLI